eukprot:TRINITY_DN1846_c0_g1_i1.p1 TRINITY_DN1846_c0_g1~~TRINITY_DN1846_c0_g1_i1.p1  ORF type:complete len:383 (-),score=139.66 TRINITY_DN1846_c0_g1_i1:64-1212(-)
MEKEEDPHHSDINAAAETLGSLDSSRMANSAALNVDILPPGEASASNSQEYENNSQSFDTSSIQSQSIEQQQQQQQQQVVVNTEGAFYTAPSGIGFIEWNQKEWNEMVQDILIFFVEKEPTDARLFHTERQTLPDNFETLPGVFCYPYKGNFLPSGHADGRVWKPSQGAKLTGTWMYKRYFYHKDPNTGIRTKRQVSWLSGRENWWNFIEYRANSKGKVRLEDLMANQSWIDWPTLFHQVADHIRLRDRNAPAGVEIPIRAPKEVASQEGFDANSDASLTGKRRAPAPRRGVQSSPTEDAIKKARKVMKDYGRDEVQEEQLLQGLQGYDQQGAFNHSQEPSQDQGQEQSQDQGQEQDQGQGQEQEQNANEEAPQDTSQQLEV